MKFDPSTGKPIPPLEIPRNDWREKYPKQEEKKSYKLEDSADDSTLNRVIKLRVLENISIIEGEPGILYLDKTAGQVKLFINDTIGWVTLDYTPVP